MNGFFFQAEDGIRDLTVTGVQTCALPIYQLGVKMCRPADDHRVDVIAREELVVESVYRNSRQLRGALAGCRIRIGGSNQRGAGSALRYSQMDPVRDVAAADNTEPNQEAFVRCITNIHISRFTVDPAPIL